MKRHSVIVSSKTSSLTIGRLSCGREVDIDVVTDMTLLSETVSVPGTLSEPNANAANRAALPFSSDTIPIASAGLSTSVWTTRSEASPRGSSIVAGVWRMRVAYSPGLQAAPHTKTRAIPARPFMQERATNPPKSRVSLSLSLRPPRHVHTHTPAGAVVRGPGELRTATNNTRERTHTRVRAHRNSYERVRARGTRCCSTYVHTNICIHTHAYTRARAHALNRRARARTSPNQKITAPSSRLAAAATTTGRGRSRPKPPLELLREALKALTTRGHTLRDPACLKHLRGKKLERLEAIDALLDGRVVTKHGEEPNSSVQSLTF